MSTPEPTLPTHTVKGTVLKKRNWSHHKVPVQTEDIPDTVPDSEQCDGILTLDKTTKNFKRYAISNSQFSGAIYVPKDSDIKDFYFKMT